jgi:beta-lactam-binding protein with PASTA domain/predicted Ser/Thr protein kinase
MTDSRLLGGRYALGEVLGYGGMAEVHRGRDQRLGRDVAVKVLRADLARDPGFQMRFRREAQNAAALNHPAIVAVYDTGEESDGATPLPYIVMEYVAGRTLKEVLTAERRLMPERALEITADVCAALDFSHRNGIVHRDIKPGNVMLTPTGTVKVMDFGIARAVTSGTSTMTQTSAVIGTAQYLSPEQARGESVDARSDVYSTGCLLYELLTGQPPFTGDSPVSVAYQHVREDPIPPSQVDPDVTPTIDAIVLKAMAKNPANRYQTAGDMRADLLRAAAGRPVAATPVLSAAERTELIAPARGGGGSALPPQKGPGRRGFAWAGVIVAVIAVFALAALGTAWLLNRPDIPVPDLVGKAQAVAERELREAGLEKRLNTTEGPAQTKGQVLEQNPEPGKMVQKGQVVTITVNSGPRSTEVPKFTGMDYEAAAALAEQHKLEVVKADAVDAVEPEDTVVKQDPAAGTQLEEGSTIELTVSRGNLTKVPDLRGKSRDQAIALLTQAELDFEVTEEATTAVPPGQVLRQNVPPGTKRKKGTVVEFVVARAPEPSTPPSAPASPTASPPASFPPF